MRYNNKKKSKPRFKETLGRKSLISAPEKKQTVFAILLDAWMYGASDTEAAASAGIAPATLRNYLEKHPELKMAKEKLIENVTLTARKTLYTGIQKNPELALKFLERKLPDEFAPTTKAKVIGEVIHEISDDYIVDAIKVLEKSGLITVQDQG